MDKQNKYNYYIEQNILNAFNITKQKKERRKNKGLYSFILWITEFYSKEQIKMNLNQNKNIWISICSNNCVIIYSLNLIKDDKKYDSKNVFKEINRKKIDLNAEKIMRLEGCFNPNDKKNNYFLIGDFNKYESIVISVSLDYKTIEEVQKINSKDLMYSLEINHYNNKFLLHNCNKLFKVWTYDNIADIINIGKKGLNYKIINTNIKKENLKAHLIGSNNSKIIYNEIIAFIENKHLFIVYHFTSESYLTFYKIDQTKEFNINIIGELKPKKNQNRLSKAHNNCCVINNKYLLINAIANINYKFGGFYIINLDTIQIIYYYSEPKCKYFNSIIKFQNNMFICTSIFGVKIFNKNTTKNKLILYEFIEEKNEKIKINKHNAFAGGFPLISNTSLISEVFVLCSNKKTNNNSLIKIYENKIILCLYYKINEFENKNTCEIRHLIKNI